MTGTVTNRSGAPVKDVLIEVWQVNADGAFPDHGDVEAEVRGWGRIIPDFETDEFSFETVKPGAVSGRDGHRIKPHLNLWLVACGINIRLNTRISFGGEAGASGDDPVLNLIEQEHLRNMLITRGDGDIYRFKISLQDENETVFFNV